MGGLPKRLIESGLPDLPKGFVEYMSGKGKQNFADIRRFLLEMVPVSV